MALSLAISEESDLVPVEAKPSTTAWTPTQSYDLGHAKSLGTINAFGDFHSPEALRASGSTQPARTPESSSTLLDLPPELRNPVSDVSPVRWVSLKP